MDSPTIDVLTGDATKDVGAWLRAELRLFNEGFLGKQHSLPLATVAKVGDELVGAISGVVILDWLSVDAVFIAEKYRGRGLGESLLRAIEDEAKKAGATRAFVDTTSFQAEGFYAKYGYVEWGRFREFAPGVDRIYMRKDALPG
jgi:GNAT superfamily N-acetyltransferase